MFRFRSVVFVTCGLEADESVSLPYEGVYWTKLLFTMVLIHDNR
jgi:predicted protein tyrosine phosphatase